MAVRTSEATTVIAKVTTMTPSDTDTEISGAHSNPRPPLINGIVLVCKA